jgi:hypothetical protein
MDNKPFSVIKRGLKVTGNYFINILLFTILALMFIEVAQEGSDVAMPYFSFAMFWILFLFVYGEMRIIAQKEKRPFYEINPSPFKGILYGVIGIIPVAVLQIVIILIQAPEGFEVMKLRVLQALTGPLYWIAKLLGGTPIMYIPSLAAVVLMAFLGYFAGHHDFLLTEWVRKKLGIKPRPAKKRVKH